jgi:phasin family protein
MSSFQATAGFPFASTFHFTSASPDKAGDYFSWMSFGVKTLLEGYQKNVTALSEANRVAFDGLTTLLQRQGTLLNATADDCSRGMNDILAAASLEEKARRQADSARHAYESTVDRFGELYEIAMKAQFAAADILNARLAEALDELKTLFARPVESATDTAAAAREVIVESVAMTTPAEPAAADAASSPLDTDPVATMAEPVARTEDTVEDEEADPPVPRAPSPKGTPRGPRTPGVRASRRPPSRG